MKKKEDEKKDIIKLILSETSVLPSKIDDVNLKESSTKFIRLVRDFFSEVFSINYQFDFEEICTTIETKKMDDDLRKKIYSFLKSMALVGYSPVISKERLNLLIKEFNDLIHLILNLYYYPSKKEENPRKDQNKGFINAIKQMFVTKKRREKLRKETIIITHLNETIDQISESIKKENPEINHGLIIDIYSLYNSLPKNKRVKVDKRIKKLFEEIKSIKKPEDKMPYSLFSKFLSVFRIKKPYEKSDDDKLKEIRDKYLSNSPIDNEKMLTKRHIEKVSSYIEGMFKKGFDEDLIKKRLLESGWSEEVIDRLIKNYMIKA